jgi:hypothetical protein
VKTSAERSVEAITWAAVIIWLGFALVIQILNYVWLVVMVLSIILLTSVIYQRSRGWQTSIFTWVAGIWMGVFSVIEVANELISAATGSKMEINILVYLGIALISGGVAVVLRYLQMPKLPAATSGAPGRQRGQPQQQPSLPGRRQAAIPRPVEPDSGYTSAPRAVEPDSASTSAPAQQPAPPAQPSAPRAGRGRPAPAAPQQTPDDLESRVEDIIRRSREQRNKDNLPY